MLPVCVIFVFVFVVFVPEHRQGVEGGVEGVEDTLHVGAVLGVEDVVGQDPGHPHLNGELDKYKL